MRGAARAQERNEDSCGDISRFHAEREETINVQSLGNERRGTSLWTFPMRLVSLALLSSVREQLGG